MGNMTSETLSLPRPTSAAVAARPFGRTLAARDRRAILMQTVQAQVIPQLLRRPPCAATPARASVERLALLCVHGSGAEVVEFVAGLLARGHSAESIFLDLLTPAARLLGQFWVDDLYTFADVTVGTGHLQAAMRALRPAFLRSAATAAAPRRALLLPQSGEQHDFGCRMLSAFFARAGWDVWSDDAVGRGGPAEAVQQDWIDLVGLSVSHDAMLDATRRSIAAIRAASLNPDVVVMVGGLPFTLDPSLAAAVGADGTAADGAEAVRLAATLLPNRRAG